MGVKQVHLFLYNVVQGFGWAVCLWTLASAYASTQDAAKSYHAARMYAKVFQAASFLEFVHALIGLVPSNPAMALLQWAGRSNILFLILDAIPEVQSSPAGPIMLAAWAVSELIRYPWYALSILDACPSFLTWLRYTAFIPLYPVGVVCEMALLYQALPFLEKRDMYSLHMPNRLNHAFDYHIFAKVGLLIYLPAWWQLYSGLLRVRAKKLGGSGPAKAKTA